MKRVMRLIWLFFYKKFSVTTPSAVADVLLLYACHRCCWEGRDYSFFVDGWLLYIHHVKKAHTMMIVSSFTVKLARFWLWLLLWSV